MYYIFLATYENIKHASNTIVSKAQCLTDFAYSSTKTGAYVHFFSTVCLGLDVYINNICSINIIVPSIHSTGNPSLLSRVHRHIVSETKTLFLSTLLTVMTRFIELTVDFH